MKIQEFFDKGYYINLDRRTDRKEHIESVLSSNNLLYFFKRISAKDGINEPDPIKKHHYCSLSHHKVINDALKNNYNQIVVFEDDFTFYNCNEYKGIDNIEKGLSQLQNIPDWDIIFFGGYVVDLIEGNEVEKISSNLLKVKNVLTLHGVGISKNGLVKLSQHKPFNDSFIDAWVGKNDNLNKYIIYPFSSYQINLPSDLDVSGRTPEVDHWKLNYLKKE